jgi:hypothetical protein
VRLIQERAECGPERCSQARTAVEQISRTTAGVRLTDAEAVGRISIDGYVRELLKPF